MLHSSILRPWRCNDSSAAPRSPFSSLEAHAEESIQKKEKTEKVNFYLRHNFQEKQDFQRVQIWNDRSQKQKKNYGSHPFKHNNFF
jgi:hypothetical protein